MVLVVYYNCLKLLVAKYIDSLAKMFEKHKKIMKIPNSRCRSQTHFKDIAIFTIFGCFFRVLKCIRLFSDDKNRGIPTAGTQHLKRWEYRSQDATPWTGRLLF